MSTRCAGTQNYGLTLCLYICRRPGAPAMATKPLDVEMWRCGEANEEAELKGWCDTARWGAQRSRGRRNSSSTARAGKGPRKPSGFTYLASGHRRIHPAYQASRTDHCGTMHSRKAADEASGCPRRQFAGWLAALTLRLVPSSAVAPICGEPRGGSVPSRRDGFVP